MKLNKNYLLLAILLFCVEALIALFVRDTFIRPIFGDFLAVIFLYCLLKGIVNKPIFLLATTSLLLAYFLEALQFFQFLKITGLEHYYILKLLIGNSFAWVDILAYTLGFFFILFLESYAIRK